MIYIKQKLSHLVILALLLALLTMLVTPLAMLWGGTTAYVQDVIAETLSIFVQPEQAGPIQIAGCSSGSDGSCGGG